MSNIYEKYEAVIGLEIHAQLQTKSKAFAADSTEFGTTPNTNVSPITLGHPGTLPRLNEKVVEYAVRLGTAVKANITYENQFARKNYFYADLPKGYQITQDKTPICTGGYITIFPHSEKEKKINITRIHIEEDAGKSMHDQDPFNTLIDLNRAGVPLVEIVSEPEIRSSEEAYAYIAEIRKLVRYIGICDGNMEEGSLRVDANISVMPKGSKTFGTRAEVKNMNSLRNVQRAIDFEIKRQIDIIENGGTIEQETRSFDAVKGITFSLRSKEMAHDYRYFPEPDLQPVFVEQEYIQKVKDTLPPLPNELYTKFTQDLGLSDYDASIIIEDKDIALYFNELIELTNNFKAAANWINGAVKSFLNENALHISEFALLPKHIAQIIALIDDNKISNSLANQKLFPALIQNPDKTAEELAQENNWLQESDDNALLLYVEQAIAKYPEKVEEYKNGKKGLIGLFMGEVMKLSKGKADPKLANKLVREKLEK
jgi:aspartyl-tRNA(Asn)/glutamyl-tRNA(Gln) amidotransferase subunit B